MYSYWTILIVIAIGLLVYRYNRQAIAAVREFDRRNNARIAQEMEDRRDALAHFRHTAGVDSVRAMRRDLRHRPG